MGKNTHALLADVVAGARCMPGWSFRLKNEEGDLRMVIRVQGYDSAFTSQVKLQPYTVDHYFPVPAATYNERTWRRWVFEMCRRVMNHEIGEWMRWGNDRPFAPMHGPGEDPYTVHEIRPVTDALTTQSGAMRDPYFDAQDPT